MITEADLYALEKRVRKLEEKIDKTPCASDCISRQAVLDKIKEVCFSEEWARFRADYGSNGQRDLLINYIEQLPHMANDVSLQKDQRKFEEIVVQYDIPEDLCTYLEYKGKPYFSIKYEQNGKHHVGFGTYKPEVLSRYLKEYFIHGGVE